MAVSLQEEAERIFELMDDERHLAALEVLGRVQQRISQLEKTLTDSKRSRKLRKPRPKRSAADELEGVKQLLSRQAMKISTLQVSGLSIPRLDCMYNLLS